MATEPGEEEAKAKATKCRWVAFVMQWKCKNHTAYSIPIPIPIPISISFSSELLLFRSLCPLLLLVRTTKSAFIKTWMQFARDHPIPPALLLLIYNSLYLPLFSILQAYLSVFNLSKQIKIWIEFVVVVHKTSAYQPLPHSALSPPRIM